MEGISKRMKTITDRLLELDTTLSRHNEGAWDKAYDPTLPGFSSFNDAGVECETGEFLYSMVRILKPKFVLETGTHVGVGASYMGLALEDNNHGELITIEFIPELREQAVKRFERIGLSHRIHSLLNDVQYYQTEDKFDLILLDTEPQTRFREFLQFAGNLNPGGFIFIHDLHPHMQQIDNPEHGFAWPYGRIPAPIIQAVFNGAFRPMHFKTPRGLTGFYKVDRDNDYKWGQTL